MKLKTFNPITPSLRNLIQLNKTKLTKKPLLKSKIGGFKQKFGRNFTGKITSYHKGGGHKKKYRVIDFNRTTDSVGIVTIITCIEMIFYTYSNMSVGVSTFRMIWVFGQLPHQIIASFLYDFPQFTCVFFVQV